MIYCISQFVHCGNFISRDYAIDVAGITKIVKRYCEDYLGQVVQEIDVDLDNETIYVTTDRQVCTYYIQVFEEVE